MTVAFLFPGQGAQYPGMLHGLLSNFAARSIITRATESLGYDALTLDSAGSLSRTVAAQLATFITSVAALHALSEQGAAADATAGLSLGAFGAAVACGALTFEAALKLVQLRATLMEEECPPGHGLSVIVGLSENQVRSLLSVHSTQESPVYIANINAPQEVVIAGHEITMDRVLAHAFIAGARRAERLAISVPSHCPLLSGVARKLKSAITETNMSTPRICYISNRSARPLLEPEAIREDLATNVEHPVRWHEATNVLFESGVRLFVELPPGYKLSALAANAFCESRAIAVESSSLNLVADVIKHHKMSGNLLTNS